MPSLSKTLARKNTLAFSVGPRQVLVVFDQYAKRIIVRAIIHNGQRVDRAQNPELWKELRDDFTTALNLPSS